MEASLDGHNHFESWKEKATVRADADLVAEIRRGLAALKRGKAKLYTLDELFSDSRPPGRGA